LILQIADLGFLLLKLHAKKLGRILQIGDLLEDHEVLRDSLFSKADRSLSNDPRYLDAGRIFPRR
jgi:hypothetical protein